MDWERANLDESERKWLETVDIDDILPDDDWWYTLEDDCCDSYREEVRLNGSINGF